FTTALSLLSEQSTSCIKSIMEGDTSPSWPIILCVSNIIDDKSLSTPSLELTDGIYKIYAYIDPPLQRAIDKSKIIIGCKLEICGARIYRKSVEKTSILDANSIYLRISGNSTKLTDFNSKLGFGKLKSFTLLNSLTPDGGYIGGIDVIVIQKYPLLYRETTKDGLYIIRNEEDEKLVQRKFTEQLQNKVLPILEKCIPENLNETDKWINEQLKLIDFKSVPLITVWRPNSSLYDSIVEGQRNQICSLIAVNNQSYNPNLLTEIPLIHLSSMGNTTVWKEQKADLNNIRNSLYNP
ncbi:9621_t:CDS:2, partial [Entrophospora sp. SA101]